MPQPAALVAQVVRHQLGGGEIRVLFLVLPGLWTVFLTCVTRGRASLPFGRSIEEEKEPSCNICRSPIAEAVFAQVLQERGVRDQWHVDSAALGDWHVGRSPDRRAQSTMMKHNVPMSCKARMVRKSDFREFDYVFGMDDSNISELKDLAPSNSTAKVELLGKYDPEGVLIIRDPYYDDGDEGFETCYKQCLRCCRSFLDSIGVK